MSSAQTGNAGLSAGRLVIGAGATGRTHRLRVLADGWAEGDVVWLIGSPLAAVTGDEVRTALDAGPSLLVADDLQWFDADGLQALAKAAPNQPVFASQRPTTGAEPDRDLLAHLAEVLTRSQPAERLDLLDIDAFAGALSAIRAAVAEREGRDAGGVLASDEVEQIHSATGGSVGLAADAVASDWSGTEGLPAGLVDAVATRIRRAGPGVGELVALWASADESDGALALALQALPDDFDPDPVERSARAGGLVDNAGQLIPLVGQAALADLTTAGTGAVHDHLAAALVTTDRLAAARHLLLGSGEVDGADRILAGAATTAALDNPGTAERYIERALQLGLDEADGALLRALAAFHAGSPAALAHLEQAHGEAGGSDDRSAVLAYGIDSRDLRFASAAERAVSSDLGPPLRRLAASLAGALDTDEADRAQTPLGRAVEAVATGVEQLARGAITDAVATLTTASDDFDRLRPTATFGLTPHGVGALGALVAGDLAAVDILTSQALTQRSGGAGEQLGHRLIQAHGRLVAGDYNDALILLREHAGIDLSESAPGPAGSAERIDDLDDVTEPGLAVSPTDTGGGVSEQSELLVQRDRLLLAALEAAIARRSGDTGRLRASWKRAEEALVRGAVSWLLIDPFTELLAAGARLGDSRRVTPVLDRLVAQAAALPETGPGPTAAAWLQLQVAIATDDNDGVAHFAAALGETTATDGRSQARRSAAAVWATIIAKKATEDEVVAVAEQLSAIGDGWEASRLLGQAALDEPDSKASRRMLELARISATEHVDDTSGDGLTALGLSERESEVALLVVEGRTHKEVGAQLYISPKTVEHHVAKIRQKIGASSRAELLSIIREAIGHR